MESDVFLKSAKGCCLGKVGTAKGWRMGQQVGEQAENRVPGMQVTFCGVEGYRKTEVTVLSGVKLIATVWQHVTEISPT